LNIPALSSEAILAKEQREDPDYSIIMESLTTDVVPQDKETEEMVKKILPKFQCIEECCTE